MSIFSSSFPYFLGACLTILEGRADNSRRGENRKRANTRYVLRYIIRRLFRYAKYAAIGGVAALLGGSILGTMGSGLAFFAAPGLLGGMGLGLAGGLAKVCLSLSLFLFLLSLSSSARFTARKSRHLAVTNLNCSPSRKLETSLIPSSDGDIVEITLEMGSGIGKEPRKQLQKEGMGLVMRRPIMSVREGLSSRLGGMCG